MFSESEQNINIVNEAISNYVTKFESHKQFKKEHRAVTYESFLKNRMLIVQSIRRGLPYSLFEKIKNITPFTEKDWAEFLNISTKSLQRYKNEKEHTFKPIHSEKIIELAEVTYLGKRIFDSTDQFYLWLNTPVYSLGGLEPIELLKDSYGKEMVINELNRIDQGIFI